jgi:hypothetical protein
MHRKRIGVAKPALEILHDCPTLLARACALVAANVAQGGFPLYKIIIIIM